MEGDLVRRWKSGLAGGAGERAMPGGRKRDSGNELNEIGEGSIWISIWKEKLQKRERGVDKGWGEGCMKRVKGRGERVP